ncbi:hypothetical protein [Streptomyces coffeae]|uniref:Uncharacterized protein n=1 Tax=Streptomyces coffeae TaxID=621382 RepID=A0ABS1NIM7_9ACTN|nr:hypothetical protein [Streptomyces coffeae]MBL1099745.1 hypothetical protein [Streptomyces coffeae]
MNPTLVTPGPQPVEAAGPGADDVPQVLRGEVVGPRHARRRPVDNRRKAAAGAILLSATGAATALFLLMGKDARPPTAAPDTSSSAPDRPDAHTSSLGESAVGDAPLRGSRAERPAPAAADRADAAPSDASAHEPGSSSGPRHSAASRQDLPGRGSGHSGDWQDGAEQLRRWARAYAEQHNGEHQGQGHGKHRYDDGGGGNGQGNGYGNGQGEPGRWGGGHGR